MITHHHEFLVSLDQLQELALALASVKRDASPPEAFYIQIDTACHGWALRPLDPPAARRIDRERHVDCRTASPARHPSRQGAPLRITDHLVVQSTRLLMVGKYRG
jgi:hypothetical protein